MPSKNKEPSLLPEAAQNLSVLVVAVGAGKLANVGVHAVNHTSEYDPLFYQVQGLDDQNEALNGKKVDPTLHGYKGSDRLDAHLDREIAKNDAQIKTLIAREPTQHISQLAETGIGLGGGLIGAFTALAVMRHMYRRKVRKLVQPLPAPGSKLSPTSEAE